MGFEVNVSSDGVTIGLTGVDRLFCWRRSVTADMASIARVQVELRGALEGSIQHRAFGFGTHDGSKRPGGRRVGSMLGPAARGPQFWATTAGAPDTELLVLDLTSHRFLRLVLEVDDPVAAASALPLRRLG